MKCFKALANLIIAAWFIMGCSSSQPNLQDYTGRYEKAMKEQSNYVDIIATKGELIVTASWDRYEKPLWYLNDDNFLAKGFGWAIKFIRGRDGQLNGFLMTGDTQWLRIDRDSSIYQQKKWQIFIDSAKLHTYPVNADQMRSITGKYGDKHIIVSGDHLFLIKPGSDKTQLYPISDNMFITDKYILKSFGTEGLITDEIEIRYKNGYKETLARTK